MKKTLRPAQSDSESPLKMEMWAKKMPRPFAKFTLSEIPRSFAEFILSQMKKILRCAQDDKRRAQGDSVGAILRSPESDGLHRSPEIGHESPLQGPG